jgi:hypothetical protein
MMDCKVEVCGDTDVIVQSVFTITNLCGENALGLNEIHTEVIPDGVVLQLVFGTQYGPMDFQCLMKKFPQPGITLL